MTTGLQQSLDTTGGITKALLNTLDQIEQYVAASQVGPDGKPSGTALYMHMPMGYPVDPKMYANAWTPGGGDSSSQFSDTGTFVTPPPATPTSPAPAGAPAGSVYPPPANSAQAELSASIQNAYYTSALVDQMLEVTDHGVAAAWPDKHVSVEYFTVLAGMQPVQTGQPAQDVLDAVAKAQAVLYITNDQGVQIGYTPMYAQYRHNQTAYENAVGAYASAYAQAMADPVAGQAWPVASAPLQNTVTQALADWNAMGREQVEDAINTISTVGENAIAALASQAHDMYDAYTIGLAGQVAVGSQWSYINPVSWWDFTDEDFGVQKITASTDSYNAAGGSGSSSYANSWNTQQSSSTSGGVGVSVGLWGGGVNAGHSEASNAFADNSGSGSWQHFTDSSTSATVTCEFFLATIERPWFLGDLLGMDGWYLVGHPKNSVSDGSIDTQIGSTDKILPMLPKGFVVVRNVSITADDWGSAGSAFQAAATSTDGSGQSSSTSVGASVSYLIASAHVQHDSQQSSGAFGTDSSATAGWSFTSDGNGGTLTLTGSQIVGWVGQIQPASPKVDAPPVVPDPTTATNGTTATAGNGTTAPVPAGAAAGNG